MSTAGLKCDRAMVVVEVVVDERIVVGGGRRSQTKEVVGLRRVNHVRQKTAFGLIKSACRR